MNREFWAGRRVFLTGHTGFKGSWLTQWLKLRGSQITGYALAPPTTPNLFEAAGVGEGIVSIEGDIRDLGSLRDAMRAADPEIVFHLAAQALVQTSYVRPVETYGVNVMGTVNLLEAVRECGSARTVVVVTSDKCYENREWTKAYREDEPLGGRDPYSSSKACAELVASAYRQSFFSAPGAASVVTVRAGNVIGGGDWSEHRLVPDLVRAFSGQKSAVVRNPRATRPWQFVLDPLHGYLRLAETAFDSGASIPHAWNFGPPSDEVRTVQWIADRMAVEWGESASWREERGERPHEAHILKLDSSRARALLGWKPALEAEAAVGWTASWYKRYVSHRGCARALTIEQIECFEGLAR